MASDKNKGGRPKTRIDIDQAEKLATLQCTDEELAAYFRCTTRTIENWRAKNKEFRDAVERGKRNGLISLRRAQFKAAMDGQPALLIWLGKSLLHQRETVMQQHSGPDGKPIQVKQSADLPLINEFLQRAEAAKLNEPASDRERDREITIQ